ncbi:MAG: hypothetical protein GXP54_11220 [Deltaproteobacteria bacterium]|nr:hypothetical protein [Deltaproteobacteria bacterium]
MEKLKQLMAGALVLLFSTAVFAETVPRARRGITLDQGVTEIGLEFTMGLNAGGAADAWSIGQGIPDGFIALDRDARPGAYPGISLTGYEHKRHTGFTTAYGITDDVEIGLALNAINFERVRDTKGHVTNNAEIGGGEVYVTYGFLPFMGVELGILVPGEDLADRRIGMRLGIPINLPLVEDVLSISLREDMEFYFVKGGPTIQSFTDIGITVSPIHEFYMEAFVGFRYGVSSPHGDARIPLGLLVGGNPLPTVDLGVAFTFGDLLGHGADARSLTFAAAFRF